jgi:hypothetical protein
LKIKIIKEYKSHFTGDRMIVRHPFNPIPPMPFLMQIMDATTKTYIFLWERQDRDNRVFMTWKDLARYYNKNSFKNSLRKLTDVGLLSHEQTSSDVSVELVRWDEE